MIEIFQFEELLRPKYAKLVNLPETSKKVYDNTNADLLSSGNNLFYLVLQIREYKANQVVNPDELIFNDNLVHALTKVQSFKDSLPNQDSLETLYKELVKYFDTHEY